MLLAGATPAFCLAVIDRVVLRGKDEPPEAVPWLAAGTSDDAVFGDFLPTVLFVAVLGVVAPFGTAFLAGAGFLGAILLEKSELAMVQILGQQGSHEGEAEKENELAAFEISEDLTLPARWICWIASF